MPPVPVLVPAPAPVRLNHSSSVRFGALSAGAAPNVTYWLVPVELQAVAGRGALRRCAAASFEAAATRCAEASTADDDVVVRRVVDGRRVDVGRSRSSAVPLSGVPVVGTGVVVER